MTTRMRRAVSVLSLLEGVTARDYAPTPAVPRWRFSYGTHPIDGHPMAMCRGSQERPEGNDQAPLANLVLTAVRTGATATSIERTLSVDLSFPRSISNALPIHTDFFPVELRGAKGLFPATDTSKAHKETVRVRVAWEGMATKPNIVLYRGTACFVKAHEVMMCFLREFPANYEEAPNHERDEATLTKTRSAAFPAGAKLVLGIPFMSLDYELVYKLSLDNLIAARAALTAKLTPPPAPKKTGSSSGGGGNAGG